MTLTCYPAETKTRKNLKRGPIIPEHHSKNNIFYGNKGTRKAGTPKQDNAKVSGYKTREKEREEGNKKKQSQKPNA